LAVFASSTQALEIFHCKCRHSNLQEFISGK